MCRSVLLLLIYGFISLTFSDSATQTNWTGGPGFWGQSYWGNYFYLETNIEWFSLPGVISLQFNVEHTIAGDFDGARCVFSEDINGDGDLDVLGAGQNLNKITWWENEDGLGTNWIEHTVGCGFWNVKSVYSEDIDGDGDMDVLGAAYFDDDITWWENVDGTGTSWIEHTIDGEFDGAYSVYSEDIDGDGNMDVLGAARQDGDITWWENVDGTGTCWIEHLVDGDFNNARCVYSEDIDNDGDMDILGAAGADEVTWWENENGLGTSWIEHIIDNEYDGPFSVYSEDIDGDGDMDVLSGASDDWDVTWWENLNGTGISWAEHTIDGNYRDPISVYSEDLDGDNDMDVLAAGHAAHEITWWENLDGTGTSWVKHTVDEKFFGAISVYSADIDGNGEMDVLGAAAVDNDIIWWTIGEYSSSGELESSSLYLHNDPGWGSINWTSEEPASTSIYFQVRSCDSPDSTGMGAWSDKLYTPCSLLGILDEYDSYFQYKVILETSDSSITPVLEDVTITWDPLGIEGGEPVVLKLLPFAPNPSSGSPVIRFSIPEPALVGLRVFDLSGRLVSEIHGDEYSPGFHDVELDDLSPGIYFCRMMSDEYSATQRFVVIQ